MRDPSDSAAIAAEILERSGARWALIGALAAARYRSEPRLTVDADFLVASPAGLAEAFRESGYTVTEHADSDGELAMLRIEGRGSPVDVLVAATEYQSAALARAIDHVLTAEDVIIHKLIAWRPRDRDDVVSIIRSGLVLDEAYIHRWATDWDVLARWDEARRSR